MVAKEKRKMALGSFSADKRKGDGSLIRLRGCQHGH